MTKPKLHIIKIGGNVIDDQDLLLSFLKSFAKLNGPKILVHGGGKIASSISEELGIKPQMVEGRRITDQDTLRVISMVYGGLINKGIVAILQANGCNGVGLSGADGNLIPAQKRPVKDIDYGYVGDIDPEKINAETFKILLDNNLTPVLAPLTHDGFGSMLNTNADTIASAVAVALSGIYEVDLIYCFEKSGVIRDMANESDIFENIGANEYENLKKTGIISGGMVPKLDNSFEALKKGVKNVHIVHANAIHDLVSGKKPKGTRLHA